MTLLTVILLIFPGLSDLDTLIANRAIYRAPKEYRIDSLRCALASAQTEREAFEISGRLLEEYRGYAIDSQQVYAERRMSIAARTGDGFERQVSELNIAEVMLRTGMYHEAIEHIRRSTADHPLDPVLQPYFYHLQRTLYGQMSDFSLTEPERSLYTDLTRAYRDSIMLIHPEGSFLHELVKADQLHSYGKYDSALQVLDAYAASQTISPDEMAAFAVTKAQIYGDLGRREERKAALTLSAFADLRGAVREYISLRELALLLYEEGDIERAHLYMQCAIQDAIDGSARIRTIETGALYPIVEEAYQRQVRSRQIILLVLMLNIGMIAFLLIVLLVRSHRQRERLTTLNLRLSALNEQLVELNAQLKQSDKVKTAYVGRYMETTSLLIDRFDNYRKHLRSLMQDKRYEELMKTVQSKQFTQEQLSSFYHDFDESFLALFPEFVEEVRALLRPEAELRFREGERLNTDLRVLALIRLGITDSKQIAAFLRNSLSTIYNSRTRMRNLAKGERDEFERRIADL